MLRLAQALGRIALAALIAPLPGTGADAADETAYGVGRQGWSLEYYGGDVALMRSVTPPGGAAPGEAVLILSCDRTERRLQLSFPGREPPGLAASPGYVLIRAVDRAGLVTSSLTARFAVVGRAAMVVTNRDARGDDPVLRVARMLEEQPIGLDLLVRPASRPATLGRSSPMRLGLAFSPSDGLAFGAFVKACTQAGEKYKR